MSELLDFERGFVEVFANAYKRRTTRGPLPVPPLKGIISRVQANARRPGLEVAWRPCPAETPEQHRAQTKYLPGALYYAAAGFDSELSLYIARQTLYLNVFPDELSIEGLEAALHTVVEPVSTSSELIG